MDDPNESRSPGAVSRALLSAGARVLRPLVHLLIANQVTFPALAKMLKGLYVEVAREDFRLDDRPMSQSRVSILTGVHRKDVRSLWAEPSPSSAAPESVSLGSQVVILWMTDPRFTTADGKPRPLARSKESTDAPGFDDLVTAVTQDVWPRSILDEWLRLGVAEIDADGNVVLARDAYVPERGFDEKVFFLGRNVGDHLSAASANVLGRAEPFLEREVNYLQLTPTSVRELSSLAREIGSDALEQINRKGHELKKRDADDSSADQRIAFGVYFYSEQAPSEDDEGEA